MLINPKPVVERGWFLIDNEWEQGMEFTRQIYWNVGRGTSTLLPMYLISLAAIAILVWGFLLRLKVYRQGQELNRTDNLGRRIVNAFQASVLQRKVLKGKGAGIVHGIFFWGFFVLFIGTCLIVAQADFSDPLFEIRFLTGNFYKLFSLTLDLAGLIAIVMLAGLLVRRFILAPAGLESNRDDYIIHGLLLAILLTGFVIEGARMAVTELDTPLAIWSPVGLLFARFFSGVPETTLRSLHFTTWWLHMLLVAVFLAVIPFTKLRHIFITSLNYLFADLGPKGMLKTIDLEDEETENFGAAGIRDMSWKDIFDTDACTRCKRCQDHCPAHNTEKPLSPMQLIDRLGGVAFKHPAMNLLDACDKDAIWSCTTCSACQEICPASIEHVNKIIEMRRNMVLMDGEFSGQEVMSAVDQVEVNANPLGMGYAGRGDWAEGLPVVRLDLNCNDEQLAAIDILYFVGCYASFDKRNIKVAKSFIALCADAGVSVAIMGKEERCCGEPMRKLGNEYLYQSLAAANIEVLQSYNVASVVTACPHCFNTLTKDYRDLGFDLEVEHYTVFLEQLINSGQLKIEKQEFDCTYHDSCYLGRYNDIYQTPRSLLAAAGAEVREMEKNCSESFCCSGGGGGILAEEKLGERINVKRVNMAAESGSGMLVSNCPFCLTMFEDGIISADIDDQMLAMDIAEILLERLPG